MKASSLTPGVAYRTAVGVAVAATVLLAWLSAGVGIIGADGDPANRMYAGVVAVGAVGALLARFRPSGMARTLVAMAVTQALVAAIALLADLGRAYSPPMELVALNGIFVALFVAAAMLFAAAGRGPRDRRTDALG